MEEPLRARPPIPSSLTPCPNLRPRCSPLIDRGFRALNQRAYPRAAKLRARTAAVPRAPTDAGTGHSFNYVSDTASINLACSGANTPDFDDRGGRERASERPLGTWPRVRSIRPIVSLPRGYGIPSGRSIAQNQGTDALTSLPLRITFSH